MEFSKRKVYNFPCRSAEMELKNEAKVVISSEMIWSRVVFAAWYYFKKQIASNALERSYLSTSF